MIYRLGLLTMGCISLVACSNAPTEEEMATLRAQLKANMVLVKGGTFMMGDQGRMVTDENGNERHLYWTSDSDNKPAIEVSLSDYSIYKYPVSFWEYRLYRKANELDIKHEKYIGKPGNRWLQDNYPARFENWQDARNYCQWAGKQVGQQWDLPTEAQWEYAARDRGENKPFAYDFPLDKTRYSDEDAKGVIMSGKLEPVGAMASNKLGLYQMNGHSSELVYDWYNKKWPYSGPVTDPTGPESGQEKVTRGGNEMNSPSGNTNFTRTDTAPDDKGSTVEAWRCAQSPIKLP